jgi:multidrug efflux pump subunit AcrA (membrane-fusion protein)
MAGTTADLTRDGNMLLTKARLVRDTSAVATQLAQSVGEAGAAFATKLSERAEAARTAAATAQADRAAKKVAMDVAAAKLELRKEQYKQAPNDETKRAFEEAQEEYAATRIAFEAADRATDNLDTTGPGKGPVRTTAAGPVIFKIVEDRKTGGIRLEPMTFRVRSMTAAGAGSQLRFPSINVPGKGDDEAEGNGTTDTGDKLPRARIVQNGPSTIHIPISRGARLLPEETKVTNLETKQMVPDCVHWASSSVSKDSVARIAISPRPPPGSYHLELKTITASNRKLTKDALFTIVPPP